MLTWTDAVYTPSIITTGICMSASQLEKKPNAHDQHHPQHQAANISNGHDEAPTGRNSSATRSPTLQHTTSIVYMVTLCSAHDQHKQPVSLTNNSPRHTCTQNSSSDVNMKVVSTLSWCQLFSCCCPVHLLPLAPRSGCAPPSAASNWSATGGHRNGTPLGAGPGARA